LVIVPAQGENIMNNAVNTMIALAVTATSTWVSLFIVAPTNPAMASSPLVPSDIKGEMDDDSEQERITTIRGLNDQSLLAEFAKNDKNGNVRREAVRKLQDQALLAEIAKNDGNAWVRVAAVERLSGDSSIFADIAQNDKDEVVRQRATFRLRHQERLEEIAKRNEASKARQADVRQITDRALLVEIAKNDDDERVRIVAGRKLLGEGGYAGTATSSGLDINVRLIAIQKLYDIIDAIGDVDVKDAKTKELAYLIQEFNKNLARDKDERIRQAVAERLREPRIEDILEDKTALAISATQAEDNPPDILPPVVTEEGRAASRHCEDCEVTKQDEATKPPRNLWLRLGIGVVLLIGICAAAFLIRKKGANAKAEN